MSRDGVKDLPSTHNTRHWCAARDSNPNPLIKSHGGAMPAGADPSQAVLTDHDWSDASVVLCRWVMHEP